VDIILIISAEWNFYNR